MDRPRIDSQFHLYQGNLALATTRSIEIQRGFEHVFCTKTVMDRHAVSLKEINYMFPLYLYQSEKRTLFDSESKEDKRTNLSAEFVAYLSRQIDMSPIPDSKGNLTKTFGQEDIFNFLYAVLHSPYYRIRYAEFLKMDFPRVPVTSDKNLFRSLCALGERLVLLHLMEKQGPRKTSYPISGDNIVERVRYTEPGQGGDQGRIWINREQYFESVPPEIWDFHLGGYQVCQKWLKDRKGRKLTYDDLTHYQEIVSALSETNRIMSEIDEVIEDHGGWPLR
jgi:predicted helicase